MPGVCAQRGSAESHGDRRSRSRNRSFPAAKAPRQLLINIHRFIAPKTQGNKKGTEVPFLLLPKVRQSGACRSLFLAYWPKGSSRLRRSRLVSTKTKGPVSTATGAGRSRGAWTAGASAAMAA